jgi:hypothetical protein
MTRRITLPGADELFRATGTAGTADAGPDLVASRPVAVAAVPAAAGQPARVNTADRGSAPSSGVRHAPRARASSAAERRPSGRQRHEEKITVYLSPEELISLEQARLTLRSEHGLALDRGRIVREALAVVLADLEATSDASILVRRLREA